jgi:SAM-dependent methyltransferase
MRKIQKNRGQISAFRIVAAISAVVIMAIGAVLIATGMGILSNEGLFDANAHITEIGAVLVVVGVALMVWIILRRGTLHSKGTVWGTRLTNALIAWNESDDHLPLRQRGARLVLVSVLGLFFELAMIRLLGDEIKVFAFLKNVVLIGAFLGFGLGFFLARQRVGLVPLFLPGAALLIVTVTLGGFSGLLTRTILPGGDEMVLLGLTIKTLNFIPVLLQILTWIPYYAITLLYFLFIVLVFIPLGQYTGKCMRAFAPISAYSLNLAGSLAGTLLFALVSFTWLPPLIWFAIVSLLTLPLVRARQKWLWRANLICAFGIVLLQGLPDATVWSPYNKLVISPLVGQDSMGKTFNWGYQLGVGEYYYQDLANLSDAFFQAHPNLPLEYRYSEYEVPYAFTRPESVLILGAGTGNDVSAALRRGAQHVDAVDIDPGIIDLGKRFHPEQPYASRKVSVHVNDARAFLKNTNTQYDLVLFGLLDSQQVLSAFGSVRLDNFVYTVEGMRDAFACVKPEGLLVVTFELYEPWIGERIAGVLQQATGQQPIALNAHHGTVFIIRNGAPLTQVEVDSALSKLGGVVKQVLPEASGILLTTDDWPYLYLRDRRLPFAYWTMLPMLALLSVGVAKQVLGNGWKFLGRFFFLGAAFMLMEVRIIAKVALLFGSTWVVNAAAISAVLLMAILANLLIARLKIASIRVWAALLLVTLVASSMIPSSMFLSLGQVTGGIFAALMLALPIFFAGMVFSGSLQRVINIETAMASNLLGAIVGGFVEYLSLVLGIGSLAWLAFLMYATALVFPLQTKDGEQTDAS